MIMLIKDIDNPFDYSTNGESSGEISLFPLYDVEKRLIDKQSSIEEK